MKLSNTGRAALWYAAKGIPVFRIVPGGKEPLGGHGEKDATTDPEVIERLWTLEPRCGVGAALRDSPFWVLDKDARKFGHEWLAEFECRYGALPSTPFSISGSGNPSGHHWFRRTPELEEVRARALTFHGLNTGLDLKGLRAGYVVLPPSRHPSGKRYMWEASSHLAELAPADPPAWLVRMIKARATKFTAGHTFVEPVDPESFFLGLAFQRAGLLGSRIDNGKWSVLCPNEAAHTDGRGSTSSTVLFAPDKPGGRGTFFCSHTSGCSEVFR